MQLNAERDPKVDAAMVRNAICSGLRDHSTASTLRGEHTKNTTSSIMIADAHSDERLSSWGPLRKVMMIISLF